MHLNSATTIRVPTKKGSPSCNGSDNPSFTINSGRGKTPTRDDHSSKNTMSRSRSINWSLGSNIDNSDSINDSNNIHRNISNGSLDIAASIFSSLQEFDSPSTRSLSSLSALNLLGVHAGIGGSVGSAAGADYNYTISGNHAFGLGLGMTNKEETGSASAVGLDLDSLNGSELKVDAGVALGHHSLEMPKKSSEAAAAALRRIEMEEILLQRRQPYLDSEDQHRQKMKEILHLQQQQNQILNNESQAALLNNHGRYTPVQSFSPYPPRLQTSQQLLLQEQLQYQKQRQKQSLSPPWVPLSRTRLLDFTTEELFLEVSRRRNETSSVPNYGSGDWIGGLERGGRIGGVNSFRYPSSNIGQRSEHEQKDVMNAALRGGISEFDRYWQLKQQSKKAGILAESSPPLSEGTSVEGQRDTSNVVMAPTAKTSSELIHEVQHQNQFHRSLLSTNSTVVSSNTQSVVGEENENDIEKDIPSGANNCRDRNSSFDTLLSVFGDELAELDREENVRCNTNGDIRGSMSLSGSVGTIALEDFLASGDEANDSSSCKRSPSCSDISPVNVDIVDKKFPPRNISRIIEESPSATATMDPDGRLVESIVHERTLLEMGEHLARAAGYARGPVFMGTGFGGAGVGRGELPIPSSFNVTGSSKALAELQGILIPPPPLSHSATALRSVARPNNHQMRLPPPATTKDSTHHQLTDIDPQVTLQQFLDKYGESAQNSRKRMLHAISETEKSLVAIHEWDRSRGLRKCHSRTVVKTRRSRSKVKAFLMGVDPPKELPKKSNVVKRKAGNDS